MAPAERTGYAAYVDDANEDTGSSVEGTRKYAIYDDELPAAKNRPNVGTRMAGSSKRTSLNESDSAPSHRDPDARRERTRPVDSRRASQQYDSDREREHQRLRQERKIRESEARRSHGHSPKESSRKPRPTVQHGPPLSMSRGVSDEYPRYGYQQPATPASRPRPGSRSATYYDGQPYPPPPPGVGWNTPHFPPGYFPPGPPGPPGPMLGRPGPHGPLMHYPHPIHEMSPRGMPPPSPMGMAPPGYFAGPPHPGYSDHLKARFEARPPSAMGALGGPERIPPGYSPDEFGDETAPNVMRRTSRPSRGEGDRRAMPPPERMPQRTMSAAPQPSGPYRPPPVRPKVNQHPRRPSVNRHSVNFGDDYDYDEYEPDSELFQDVSPEPSYPQRRYVEPARPRRGSHIYENVDIIPAGRRNRRASTYGGPPRSAAQYADSKIRDAQDYQDAITGGPKMPLTAEMLQKATRGNTGSQSTRSSGSRDDSEYRRSYTTGITRSSSGNGPEDVTIKFGEAEFKVRGAADFTFSSRAQSQQIRSGSDKSSTVFQLEDTRDQDREPPRMTLPHRTRAPSHSEHRPRGYTSGAYSPYEHMYPEGNGYRI
ncbi:hypothetical protein ISF_03996 [Cordyceps fumosorosea ARSEF 2679]|uniref:Uncharacterized protein n=1 Tax=Cordyceps fumosorosea (strain ARSEF 2679) TaxID=1081104 RepID=A0A162KCS1_CORFA|nr:hypothetical protein ISF_03996 [Cordyceps fumosorosea ARSEF 2679]OAA66158.1 hypothetical protein ISF_03996 [Cordyceps fumosorosea ARSEF 2679]